MSKKCIQCAGGFDFSEEDREFYRRVSPVVGGKKYSLRDPDKCVWCRQQDRLAFRNERYLYKRDCDLCGEGLIGLYRSDSDYVVYCQECFWGDKWDAKDYGVEFDFERSFFDQFGELMKKVPRLAVVNKQSVNSEYCNYAFANKNCYLLFGCHYEEDCLYGAYSTKNKNCLDYFWLYGSELCYECVFSAGCYRSVGLDHCVNCDDCIFGFDLKGCKNCLFCTNLRNKQYFIFNKQYSKEDYFAKLKELNLGSRSAFAGLRAKWEAFKAKEAIFRESFQINCQNCEGTEHQNSKNLGCCFACTDCEDCRYGFQMDMTFSSIDNSHAGYDRCELSYNTIGCSGVFGCVCCDSCWHDSELIYCNLCFNSSNCFGSVGMRHDKYCVLNKQYSKEDYEVLVAKIIEEMQSNEVFGDFFGHELYPFSYNETMAQYFMPLEKSKVTELGWRWREDDSVVKGGGASEVADLIGDVSDEVLEEVIVCEVSGRPFKIKKVELDFYRQMGLPVPLRSPRQRDLDRVDMSVFLRDLDRECEECGKEVRTIYSRQKANHLFCEECYLKRVY